MSFYYSTYPYFRYLALLFIPGNYPKHSVNITYISIPPFFITFALHYLPIAHVIHIFRFIYSLTPSKGHKYPSS